jgi:hypothetical protein
VPVPRPVWQLRRHALTMRRSPEPIDSSSRSSPCRAVNDASSPAFTLLDNCEISARHLATRFFATCSLRRGVTSASRAMTLVSSRALPETSCSAAAKSERAVSRRGGRESSVDAFSAPRFTSATKRSWLFQQVQ